MKDQRPLRYRNSLVGGKYAKKKIYLLGFFFSVFFFGYRGACTGTARLCSTGKRSALSTPDRGGLSEPPCFYKRTQEKKDTFSLAVQTTLPAQWYGLVRCSQTHQSKQVGLCIHARTS